MPALYAELFTRLSVHPIVCMMLALFFSIVAFKALWGISSSVQLLRAAFLFEVFSVYGLTIHLHVISRNVVLLWSAVFFFVFDESLPEVRWMTHWATTEQDVDEFAASVKAAVERS